MKKFILLVFAFPLLLTACKTKCVEDAGIRVSHVNTVDKFDEIEVSGPLKVVLNQDSSYAVKVDADSNIVDQIKTTVSGKTLKLKLDPEKYCGKDSIVIYTGISMLKTIKLESGSQIASGATLHLEDLKLVLKGTTAVNLNLNVAKLTTEVDGTANINLTGQAGTHVIKSKGNLTLNAFQFVVGIYNINMEGLGKSNINVLNDLKVETTGSSEIFYKGSPKNIDKKKTGNARLQKVN